MRPSLPVLALLLAAAGPAQAGTPDPLRAAAFRSPAGAEAPRPTGVARTSIESRFDRDRVTGALGYLCGRKPDLVTAGAAGARGVDHDGRFLGVQLKMSLR